MTPARAADPTVPPPKPGRLSRGRARPSQWLACGLVGWVYLASAGAATPELPGATPFYRFRDASLGYHGPSEDLTNLTELRLGWFGPTNLNDPLHGDLWWVANWAVHQANQPQAQAAGRPKPGAPNPLLPGRPFRLLPRWAVDPWGTGVSQLTRMVYEEQPLAVLGSVDSASTHLAEQVVAKAQLPLVSPVATDKTVTLAGVAWTFACAPTDAVIARLLANAVLEALQPLSPIANPASQSRPRLALLTGTDHESRMTTQELLKEFSRRGRLPDFRFDVPAGATDFSQQLAALAEAQPAVVLVCAGPEDSARLIRALRTLWTTSTVPLTRPSATLSPIGGEDRGERETPCLIFGTHSLGRHRFLQLAGAAAEGVRFPLLFVPELADPITAQFIAEFTAARGHPPDYAAALTYDATRLLIEAVRRAGPNRARVRDALHALSPWRGVAGLIHFDGTGQNTRTNLCLGTLRNGAVVPARGSDLPAPARSTGLPLKGPKP